MAQPTPVMRQWERIKAQYPDVLLLFRLGDFYELFGDDAHIVSRELELTLTGRENAGTRMPMCGVPYHAAERYIAQLLAKGYRCAICEQMEDPKYSRGLVKREVVRVLSPGTVLEDSFLQSIGAGRGNNFLAALTTDAQLTRFGLALLDISTGEFLAGEIEANAERGTRNAEICEPDEAPPLEVSAASADQTPAAADAAAARWAKLREELLRYEPAEILVPQKLRECTGFLQMLEGCGFRTTAFDEAGFQDAHQKLCAHFRTTSLRGFGVEDLPLAQSAAALALDYLKETQLGTLGHIRRLGVLATSKWMLLDNATRRNLELVQSLRDNSARGTLLGLLDETKTGAGARLLRKWILQPLLSTKGILNRQEAIS